MTDLLRSFRFEVTLSSADQGAPGPALLGDGQFAECGGLDLEADVKEYLEGGRNDGVVRRVGRVKLVPIVLKRGMFLSGPAGYADTALWDWLTDVVGGRRPVTRYNGLIAVKDPAGSRVVAKWSFERGLPVKVSGPALNARTGEIAIEELHIAHEGLRLEPRTTPGATTPGPS